MKKLKVLWLTNIIPENVCRYLNTKPSYAGGWIAGLYSSLSKTNLEFIFCFPNANKYIEGNISKTEKYFGIKMRRKDYMNYSCKIEKMFYAILCKERPDIIHIFGTEYPYCLEMVNAAYKLGDINKVIINIQGLVSFYQYYFYAALPRNIICHRTLKEIIRKNNIYNQKKDFEKRGELEQNAIAKVKYIIGRTEWDEACVKYINSDCQYIACNEILRSSFYNKSWEYNKCDKYTIFVSQANYPIKGFHFLLEAFENVKLNFPNAKIRVAGENILDLSKNIFSRNSYNKYISNLITDKHIRENIEFLGKLSEEQMCMEYLKANVFISPSSIENSSNSISEAMLIGVPIIASNVGGTNSILKHQIEGYLYQYDAPYMLAYYIKKMFSSPQEACEMAKNAKSTAEKKFNRFENAKTVQRIYHLVSNKD